MTRRLLALAALALAQLAAASVSSAGTTLVVDDDRVQCPGAPFTTIQAAVDAAAAGDTVSVCAGTYDAVDVTKALTLTGPRAATPQNGLCASLEAPSAANDAIVSGATAFTVSAGGATVAGFVVENSTVGVGTSGADSGYAVRNNVLRANTDGMRLASSGASETVVQGNCFRENARAGIFSFSGGVPVRNVGIDGNAFVANVGWGLALGEFLFGGAEVYVDGVSITRNSASGNDRFVEIAASRNLVIEDNTSSTNTTGIFLANNNVGARVANNTVEDGQTGIYISSIGPFGGLPNSGVLVSGNVVRRMSAHGISTEQGPSLLDSTLSGNTSTGNAYGIWIASGSAGNSISGNDLVGNATYDCRDDTTGAGTGGTADTWTGNVGSRQNNDALCDPPNTAPTASFTVTPASGSTATSFTFDGTASSDPDGDSLTYAWTFGDGATASGATATHAYGDPGTYAVTLAVSDGRAATASTTHDVTVAPRPTDPQPEPAPTDPQPQPAPTDPQPQPEPQPQPAQPPAKARAAATVRVEVNRGGYVRSSDRRITCGTVCTTSVADGETLHLEAVPDTKSTFTGWVGGGCAGTDPTCAVVVTGPVTVRATFARAKRGDPVVLSATVAGAGAVATWEWGLDAEPLDCPATRCVQRYVVNATVRVVAIPRPGSSFAGWSGACARQGSWCTVRMERSRQVHAVFTSSLEGGN